LVILFAALTATGNTRQSFLGAKWHFLDIFGILLQKAAKTDRKEGKLNS